MASDDVTKEAHAVLFTRNYQFSIFSLMVLIACSAAVFGVWRVSQLSCVAAIVYAVVSARLMTDKPSCDESDAAGFVRSCVVWSLAFLLSFFCLVIGCWAWLAVRAG